MIRILHVDSNHTSLIEGLSAIGFESILDTTSSKNEIEQEIEQYHGLVIRSRFPIDKSFLSKAKNLRFIARVGSGLENIDVKTAQKMGIAIIAAPEGNSPAVGEHAIGMLLSLFNNIPKAHQEVQNGIWQREENRGEELGGKTVGIVGYGHTGKQFARMLSGFDVTVLCHDILPNIGDGFAKQVALEQLQAEADILSLHLPLNDSTFEYVNEPFIDQMQKAFWLINTARGNQVVMKSLKKGLEAGAIKGACLDVLDSESKAFDATLEPSEEWSYLSKHPKVLFTPHVAGWTQQSHRKLSEVIVAKIKALMVS